MSPMACFTPVPSEWSRSRSGPKILMAICACVPESMASMRWEMGWPTSMLVPGSSESRSRSSWATSARVRPLSRE